ncbi:MAG: hypothetical protein IKL92_01515, partial [Oscillospiraceae bacterium]|nr:hypothetical protein [Oscillospiraceae bacterium]
VFAIGIFAGRIESKETAIPASGETFVSEESSFQGPVKEFTEEDDEGSSMEISAPEPFLPEEPYGRINILRVYRNSENGVVEMSQDGTGGFSWSVDESDLTNAVINFRYSGSANNRQDIMKELGYSEKSRNIPLTVELGFPKGYENVIQKIDEGETDKVMRVCSIRNGILEEGVNDFWYEWHDSEGILPDFAQTITLKIDYGSGFDAKTPFDVEEFKNTPGMLNVIEVYRSTTDGDIALERDKFDYRTVYATDDSGRITDIKVTYAYTGPSLSAKEMKENLHFFEDKTSRIIMKLAPPVGYNGMTRLDGNEDGFFHLAVSQNGSPYEDKRTFTVTWEDSTGSLPDLTQKLVFDVDYGERITAAPTGYAPTINADAIIPDGVGAPYIEKIYRETANGDVSI